MFTFNSLVVYTANFGSYSSLQSPPVYLLDKCKFVCFTDCLEGVPAGWNPVLVSNPPFGSNSRLNAKYYKILPHLFFPQYSYSLWIDSNLSIHSVENLLCLLDSFVSSSHVFSFFNHPSRQCLYQEARVCIRYGKDASQRILKQVSFYKSLNIPNNLGLLSGRVLLRKHQSSSCIEAMNLWWDQILTFSIRDQISLPYVFHINSLRTCSTILPASDLLSIFNINHHSRYCTFYPGMNTIDSIRATLSSFLYHLSSFGKRIIRLFMDFFS